MLAYITCFANNKSDDYFFKKVNYQQGLSNSAVLCLFQDNEGLMWFGTYDGINCWDGKEMNVYRSDFSKSTTLTNNVIHSISQADSSCLWIATHLGVNRLSQNSRHVEDNYYFNGDYYLHSNSKGNTWVVNNDNIYYFNTKFKRFIKVNSPEVSVNNMDKRSFVTNDGTLWMFLNNSGKLLKFTTASFDGDTLQSSASIDSTLFHYKNIDNVFYQNGIICFVDSDSDLYMYDIVRKSKIYIRNLSSLIHEYGNIMSIVPFYEDIIIGFHVNGLVRLRTSKKYEAEIIDRNVRIFDLYQDFRQNILWVASDGQGAIMYAKKYSIATNFMINQFSPNLSRQVRSIMTDKYGGLWFGTKGDGLLHIPNYQKDINIASIKVYSLLGTQNVQSYKRWNRELNIYKLLQSSYMEGFWIGAGEQGLCYYSFVDNKLHEVKDATNDSLIEIHDIYEESDSILYIVTAGNGFRKLTLEHKSGKICLKSQKRYHFYYEHHEITMFYPMLAEGDSILWLGSRENGLVRFNKKTEEYQVISLKEKVHKSVDDILSLYRTKDGYIYAGTTSGLVSINFEDSRINAQYIGREQGLLNDMIHGVLEDDNGVLWLGTNRGLIKYNPKNGSSQAYYYSAGVKVGEFSDDAYYRCPYTGRLFFGGIDGLVFLNKEVAIAPEYYPNVILRKMIIGRTEVNIEDYMKKDNKTIVLKGSKLSFSFSFVVPDFLNGSNVEYSYILDGYDTDWTSFSSINEADYVDVPHGQYSFKVRYKKDVFNTEYKVFHVHINIMPPWYFSILAYIFYALFLICLVVYLIKLLNKYLVQNRNMQRLLVVENNRELSDTSSQERGTLNTLTIIYRSCDQLRAENLPYSERLKIAEQIHEALVESLFHSSVFSEEEFIKLFPTEYNIVGNMYLKILSQEVVKVLEAQGVNLSILKSNISDDFIFPVYKNVLRCILYGCYLFIAKVGQSLVNVNMKEEDGLMLLQFSSDDKNLMNGLYKYLSDSDFSSSMLKNQKNKGDAIDLWQFRNILTFPLTKLKPSVNYNESDILTIFLHPAIKDVANNSERKKVLLLEDRDEMVWLINDLLSKEFEIHQVKNIQQAFDEIRSMSPTIFLVDMQMYEDAESMFINYVGKKRLVLEKTLFVPMLSWKVKTSINRELLLWADSFIVLPYDILFLREITHKLIYGKRTGRQIYIEEIGDWAKHFSCVTEEQVDFLRQIFRVIEINIQQEDLGSAFIANQLAMSPRQFYRKFKEISDVVPSYIIRMYRMEKASRLLLDEDFSIQDVINDVGISSRSYFYKEFASRFGMTPKEYREKNI